MNKSDANYSAALGGYNESGVAGTPMTALYTIAMGARNKTLAEYATAMGYYTEARGVSSTSEGSYTIAYDQV